MEKPVILFSLLGLPVTAYALCVVLSLGAGMTGLWLRARKSLRPGTLGTLLTLALPLGLLGARAFYCLARLSFYLEVGAANMLYLWYGGYALWGAVGGVALAAFLTARITRQSTARLLDALAAPAALTIALCRFSEYFSGEGIGMYVENEALRFFPLAVSNEWGEWYWAIFVLEGLAALAIMACLLRQRARRPGDAARLFLLLYSACQVLLESLRRDNFPRWLFVRVSQLTAVIVLAVMMLFALGRWLKARPRRVSAGRVAVCWLVFLLCVGACIALEFAVDKFPYLPIWLDYCLMAGCCVGLGWSAYQLSMKN